MSINPYSFYDADMAAYGMTESPYTSTAGNMSAYAPATYTKQHKVEHFDEHDTIDEASWSSKDKKCPGSTDDKTMIKIMLFIAFIAFITFIVYAYVSTLIQVTSLTEKVNMLQSQHASMGRV